MNDTSDYYPPPRPLRMTTRAWIVIVVLLAVIAALLCWRHLRDGRAHAALGTTIVAGAALGTTTSSSVILPDGRLNISATAPLDDVESDPAVRAKQAPDDGSFVGVQIVQADEPAVARWSFGESSRTSVTTGFALVADGRRYPITRYDSYGRKLDEDSGSTFVLPFVSQRVYVAIAGHPDRLQLEVTYAGAKQLVDLRTGAREPGRFAPLYANKAVSRGCATATWTAGFAAEAGSGRACTVDLVQRTPYYPGFGWAPSGRTWVVAATQTSKPDGVVYRADGRTARYETYGLPKVKLTLDGVAAKDTGLFSNVFGSSRRDVSLFSAPTGTRPVVLGVTVTYEHVGIRSDSVRVGVPTGPDVVCSWRVAL